MLETLVRYAFVETSHSAPRRYAASRRTLSRNPWGSTHLSPLVVSVRALTRLQPSVREVMTSLPSRRATRPGALL